MSVFRYETKNPYLTCYIVDVEAIANKKKLYQRKLWCAYNHLFCSIAPVRNKERYKVAHPKIIRVGFV